LGSDGVSNQKKGRKKCGKTIRTRKPLKKKKQVETADAGVIRKGHPDPLLKKKKKRGQVGGKKAPGKKEKIKV